MFLQNKYAEIYFAIVDRARNTIYKGYTEKHHIIPKSLGGLEGSNIVRLTAREHFICHRLLVRMTAGKDKSKMAVAVLRLCNPTRHHALSKVTGRKYEHIKIALSASKKGIPAHPNTIAALNKSRNKNGGPHKGKTIHPNARAALSEARIGVALTEEHKKKLSVSLSGRKRSAEQRKTISESYFSSAAKQQHLKDMHENKKGIPLSAEHKKKLSEAVKGKKISEENRLKLCKPKQKLTCPHCNLTGGSSQLKRYHFDKCKFL